MKDEEFYHFLLLLFIVSDEYPNIFILSVRRSLGFYFHRLSEKIPVFHSSTLQCVFKTIYFRKIISIREFSLIVKSIVGLLNKCIDHKKNIYSFHITYYFVERQRLNDGWHSIKNNTNFQNI